MKIEELIGTNLDAKDFTIQEFTEVYKTNEDGMKSKSVGFFKSEGIAKAFSQTLADPEFHNTEKRMILTNGKDGFVIGGESVKILDDEKAALEVRQKAIKKLSLEERRILGL